MLHFVIKDANPTILENGNELVKVLNESVLLITAANGPMLNHSALKKDESQITFKKSENSYEASFKSSLESDKLNTGKFVLLEDGALIMELAFTVNQDQASTIRVKLNCEGERLVRQELERAFERSFSFEAEAYMKGDFSAKDEVTDAEPSAPIKAESIQEEIPDDDEGESDANFILEMDTLSPKLLQDLSNPGIMLDRFNSITHDISRGAVGDFSMNEIEEEIIENGAKIQFLDYEYEDFIVTFRLGELKGETEVSFFLEEGDELIFSIHCSSQGHGTITTEDDFLGPRIEQLLN